jgi:ribosomal protein L36
MKRTDSLIKGKVSRAERDCQAVRREGRIIHHHERQYLALYEQTGSIEYVIHMLMQQTMQGIPVKVPA